MSGLAPHEQRELLRAALFLLAMIAGAVLVYGGYLLWEYGN